MLIFAYKLTSGIIPHRLSYWTAKDAPRNLKFIPVLILPPRENAGTEEAIPRFKRMLNLVVNASSEKKLKSSEVKISKPAGRRISNIVRTGGLIFAEEFNAL